VYAGVYQHGTACDGSVDNRWHDLHDNGNTCLLLSQAEVYWVFNHCRHRGRDIAWTDGLSACDWRHDLNDEQLLELAEAFTLAGFEFYLVGGTVRDELLGRDAHDLDATTNARPDDIKAILEQFPVPLRIFTIGEKFGTVSAIFPDGATVEITTYRSERYATDSRKPLVMFGASLVDDLARRDFTINALAKNPLTGEVIDSFNGQVDLASGLIRCVGNPVDRFLEDPLRMIRACRFAAQLDFQIDSGTGGAIAADGKLIAILSSERIRDELLKILLADHPRQGFQALQKTGLLDRILPELTALIGVEQMPYHTLDAYKHTLLVVSMVSARPDVRLAALLHDIGKSTTHTVVDGFHHFYGHEDVGAAMAYSLLHRLRFPHDVCRRVARLVQLHMRVNMYEPSWSIGAVRRLRLAAKLPDGDVWDDLLDLAAADQESDRTDDHMRQHEKRAHLRIRAATVLADLHGQLPQSPLNGNELCAIFGKEPGPWIRGVKDYLAELVLDTTLLPGDKVYAEQLARLFFMRKNNGN